MFWKFMTPRICQWNKQLDFVQTDSHPVIPTTIMENQAICMIRGDHANSTNDKK